MDKQNCPCKVLQYTENTDKQSLSMPPHNSKIFEIPIHYTNISNATFIKYINITSVTDIKDYKSVFQEYNDPYLLSILIMVYGNVCITMS